MTTTVTWDAGQWGPVFRYDSVDEFCAIQVFDDGVHQVSLAAGGVLEIMLRGRPTDSTGPIPVFYSGAVNRADGAVGPFFSGVGVTQELGAPLVAIADPILRESESLRIGWYTGMPGDGAQEAQVRVLNHISAIAAQELLLVGGSAGGFGILAVAGQLERAKVFVWNPQTDIIRYTKGAVQDYLEVVLGMPRDTHRWPVLAREQLAEGGIRFDLTDAPVFPAGLVIQNDSDWHLRGHLGPYLIKHGFDENEPGVFAEGERRAVVFNFGQGHASPHVSLTTVAVKRLLEPGSTGMDAIRALEDAGYLASRTEGIYPLDMRTRADEVAESLHVKSHHSGVKVVAWTEPDFAEQWPQLRVIHTAFGPTARIRQLREQGEELPWVSTGQKNVRLETQVLDLLNNVVYETETQVPRPDTREA